MIGAATPRIERREELGSTHDALREAWRASEGRLPSGTGIATFSQTSGRGRHGRAWIAPPGKTLALSVLVVAGDAAEAARGFGWLTLAAGLAVRDVLAPLLPAGADLSMKWPNDVLVDGRKISGILGELLDPRPGSLAASIGIGLNLTLGEDELPVPHATSLAIAGVEVDDALRDRLPEAIAARLLARAAALEEARWDAEASGLRAELERSCSTVGQQVRATLPGGDAIVGRAVGIDGGGRLLIERADRPGAEPYALAAGDVERVRPTD